MLHEIVAEFRSNLVAAGVELNIDDAVLEQAMHSTLLMVLVHCEDRDRKAIIRALALQSAGVKFEELDGALFPVWPSWEAILEQVLTETQTSSV